MASNLNLKFLLIHLQHPDSEVILEITKINFIHKLGNVFYVHFTGGSEPLQLPKEMGNRLWELMRSSSIIIQPQNEVNS